MTPPSYTGRHAAGGDEGQDLWRNHTARGGNELFIRVDRMLAAPKRNMYQPRALEENRLAAL